MKRNLLLQAVVLGSIVLVSSLAYAEDEKTLTLASKRNYVVLAPPESVSTPCPLVLFLHPCTDPNGNIADHWKAPLEQFKKDYWPSLKDRKCVVVMPISKTGRQWAAEDGKYIEEVLADASKQYRVDANRAILLGLSGGGQTGLFLADHGSERFRAVVMVGTSPWVIRNNKEEWFYPNRKVIKTCPYFVINHLTEGTSILYWRKVREMLAPEGASISILPVVGAVTHTPTPPKELWTWLDQVLAGQQPPALADIQQAAVASDFKGIAANVAKALESAAALPATQQLSSQAKNLTLSAPLPAGFEHSKRKEDKTDAAGRPLAEVRIEHSTDAVYVNCDARAADVAAADVMAQEEKETILRGMLYQVYSQGEVQAGTRHWKYVIGSMTYPNPNPHLARNVGWVTMLFVHGWTPLSSDGKSWAEVTAYDVSGQPLPEQLAGAFKSVAAGVEVKNSAAASAATSQASGE